MGDTATAVVSNILVEVLTSSNVVLAYVGPRLLRLNPLKPPATHPAQ